MVNNPLSSSVDTSHSFNLSRLQGVSDQIEAKTREVNETLSQIINKLQEKVKANASLESDFLEVELSSNQVQETSREIGKAVKKLALSVQEKMPQEVTLLIELQMTTLLLQEIAEEVNGVVEDIMDKVGEMLKDDNSLDTDFEQLNKAVDQVQEKVDEIVLAFSQPSDTVSSDQDLLILKLSGPIVAQASQKLNDSMEELLSEMYETLVSKQRDELKRDEFIKLQTTAAQVRESLAEMSSALSGISQEEIKKENLSRIQILVERVRTLGEEVREVLDDLVEEAKEVFAGIEPPPNFDFKKIEEACSEAQKTADDVAGALQRLSNITTGK